MYSFAGSTASPAALFRCGRPDQKTFAPCRLFFSATGFLKRKDNALGEALEESLKENRNENRKENHEEDAKENRGNRNQEENRDKDLEGE